MGLDIKVIIHRTLVYGAMTAVLTGCYVLFLEGLTLSQLDHAGDGRMLTLAFFVAVTLTFTTLRDHVRQIVDRLIYRDGYDYAATLRDLGDHLASLRPLDETLSKVAATLAAA